MATLKREFPRSLSALGDIFDFLGTAFAQNAVDERSAFWVDLATEELFTNMVRHNQSNGDHIQLSVEITDDAISMTMIDFAVDPFDPDSLPAVDPSLPAEARTPGGLGVFIVRSKVDDLRYRHSDGDMIVSFTKNRKSTQ